MLGNPSLGWGRTVAQVLRLGRLHFVGAGLLLFLLGALLATLHGADLALRRLILGYLAFFPAHLSVSYSNDYFDADMDGLGRPTLFTGGSGILTANPSLRPLARRLAIGLMACSVLLGLFFTLTYDYPLWFFAYLLAGNALGWFYSAPPLRLSARGLGEIATTLTIGLGVPSMAGWTAASGCWRRRCCWWGWRSSCWSRSQTWRRTARGARTHSSRGRGGASGSWRWGRSLPP